MEINCPGKLEVVKSLITILINQLNVIEWKINLMGGTERGCSRIEFYMCIWLIKVISF
jgi:hypothetical protein